VCPTSVRCARCIRSGTAVTLSTHSRAASRLPPAGAMADEMEAIRAKRMAELSQQYGVRARLASSPACATASRAHAAAWLRRSPRLAGQGADKSRGRAGGGGAQAVRAHTLRGLRGAHAHADAAFAARSSADEQRSSALASVLRPDARARRACARARETPADLQAAARRAAHAPPVCWRTRDARCPLRAVGASSPRCVCLGAPEAACGNAGCPCLCALAVSRIALVKPDKARGVENMVLSMAQRGQITEPVRRSARRLRVPWV
jgi:DNA-binding TFAR19-related protein (PDSD5 family)